jgi:hypothetical protein
MMQSDSLKAASIYCCDRGNRLLRVLYGDLAHWTSTLTNPMVR